MPATEEQKAVGLVLSLLQSKGTEWTRLDRPPAVNAATIEATRKFSPIERTELERHFLHGGNRGQFRENQAIYIVPPTKETSAAAALWCRWDFDLALPKCAFYFGIWSQKPTYQAEDARTESKHTAFVGFRYETPEEGENHDYCHAQPCRSMGARDDPIMHALPLSTRYPTFPLAAESSLELLLCLIVSLYGMNGLSEIRERVLEDAQMRNNKMLCGALNKVLSH